MEQSHKAKSNEGRQLSAMSPLVLNSDPSVAAKARYRLRLLDLANEIILLICDDLNDNDLLTLCQASHQLHILSLSIFLARHGISNSHIQSGAVTLSTDSLPGFRLALFFTSIHKLSCVFEEVTAERDVLRLEYLVSKFPCISEVELTIRRAHPIFSGSGVCLRDAHDRLFTAVIRLISTLVAPNSEIFFILRDGRFSISSRSHTIRGGPTSGIGSVILKRFIHILSPDPPFSFGSPAATLQEARVRTDIGNPPHSPLLTLCVKSPILPILPLSKWTGIIFNSSSTTSLRIECMPSLANLWSLVLPSIHLSALTHLAICKDASLEFAAFISFIQRHPTTECLFLGHHSILPSSLSTPPMGCFPKLKTLVGSAQYVYHILRSGEDFINTKVIFIGPPPRSHRQGPKFADYPNPTKPPEMTFDFDLLNDALDGVAGLHGVHGIELGLTIPGKSGSKQWLADGIFYSRRVERRLHNVTLLSLCTEHGISLSSDTLPLLGKWLSLFPSLSRVQFFQRTIPGMSSQAEEDFVQSIYRACSLIESVNDVVVGGHHCFVFP